MAQGVKVKAFGSSKPTYINPEQVMFVQPGADGYSEVIFGYNCKVTIEGGPDLVASMLFAELR